MMKIGLLVPTTALLALGLVGVAQAGLRNTPFGATIDRVHTTAQGQISGARSTPDETNRLLCAVYTYADSANMYCYAIDSSGDNVTCSSSAPAFVEAARSIQSDSWIEFTWNGSACASLIIMRDSASPPKQM
ncbi:MAG TPA: hypothetical protein VNO21_23860 [Polyangiaceae bacterium]|nr:hypothetical protein [Polyangiaceae bacterium]